MKRFLSVILAALLILPCFYLSASAASIYKPDGLSAEYYSMMSSGNDELLLGSISAKYESNGNPGSIYTGSGNASFGAYQFSTRYGVPLSFAEWCVSSGEGVSSGNRLLSAYKADGNAYGSNFKSTWSALAAENSDSFLKLQHNYTKAKFYDTMVTKLESRYPGFKIDNYTIALKNVIWSRAVQHGVNSDVIFAAIDSIGGFNNQSEDVLIKAIYAQSSKLVYAAPNVNSIMITSSSATKYGVDPLTVAGRYMYYFSTNSSDVQVSVYKRLAVNELNDALKMYETYAGTAGGGDTTDTDTSDTDDTTATIIETLLKLLDKLIKMTIELINALATFIASQK